MKKQLLAAIAATVVLGYFGSVSLNAQTGTSTPAKTTKAMLVAEPLSPHSQTSTTSPTTSSSTTVADNTVKADLLAAQPPSLHAQTSSAPPASSANMTLADVNKKVDDLTKKVESPDAIYYKGVTLSPAGSFVAAETVNRTTAAASGINTAFTGIPLNYSDASELSEFYGTGRQSRIALTGVGKLDNMTLTGHWEADWLSAGADSNNNQSNSYTLRQRVLYAEAKMTNGWDVSAGTGWDLVAETTKGLQRGTEILPATIDAQYEAGFAWTRQFTFRFTKDIGQHVFAGISIENAETLNPGGQNLPSNILIGSAGAGGGHFNAGANYSFNYAPDLVAKIAVEPGWGHWELFGIERTFRDRIYPTTGTPYNTKTVGAGVGGGFRGPLVNNKATIYLKGLYGQGVGRYGSSTIGDITLRPDGSISPLHGFSGLGGIQLDPNKRLSLYIDYGGDYIGRDWRLSGTSEVGYGAYTADMSGCLIEPASTAANPSADPTTPGNSTNKCAGNNKDVQEFTAGYWFNFYNGPKGRLRQGIQYSLIRRDLWSGAGGTLNPGGGSHGDDNMIFTSFRYYLP
ncbi:MAG: hypothetical protein ACLQM6_11405 [Acidobacteriaceae bacterium]